MTSARTDLYTRVTGQIVAQLEAGTRPWVQPWQAGHAAGEVSRPLRYNAVPYRGINVVLLWLAAMRAVFTAADHAQRAADYLHALQEKPVEIAA